MFQSLQSRVCSYNENYLMWKLMQKLKTPTEHGIAWVKYVIDLKTKI